MGKAKNKSWKYLFNSGKNSKIKYYSRRLLNYWCIPRSYYQQRLDKLLKQLDKRKDKEYIMERVNYYCKLQPNTVLPENSPVLGDFKRKGHISVYFHDSYEILRYFPNHYKWNFLFKDINWLMETPTFVKSRPTGDDNYNSIILNMDKVRHFVFPKDNIRFEDKWDKAIFRGQIIHKPRRIAFCERWFGDPMCDIGEVGLKTDNVAWHGEMIPIYDHFKYKFIVALEGNDVASNLKWVMHSNSIAIMPRPTCETWFMEGKLIPNYHYAEIKEDYSDLKEVMQYYIDNPDKANEIIQHAHEFVEQFFNPKRERLIALLVADKFFKMTGQR